MSEKEDKEEIIVVVSDTHFGNKDAHADSLSKFIDHIKKWSKNEIKVKGTNKVLNFPSKIILLGDIFEMWIPRSKSLHGDNCKPCNPKRPEGYMFFDAYPSLYKLKKLGCDIIYVAGNHDFYAVRFFGNYSWVDFEPTSPNIKIHEPNMFESYYPSVSKCDDKQEIKTLPIETIDETGNRKENYLFMHGQQLDKNFVKLGDLWKIQSSLSYHSSGTLKTFKHILLGLTIVLTLLWPVNVIFNVIPGSIMQMYFTSIFFMWIITILLCESLIAHIIWELYRKVVYNFHFRIKHKDILSILEKNIVKKWWEKRLNGQKSHITNLTIVYGHTHIPEEPLRLEKNMSTEDLEKIVEKRLKERLIRNRKSDDVKQKDIEKIAQALLSNIPNDIESLTLVNSGSWQQPEQGKVHEYDSFVYIDDTGPRVLRWDKKNNEITKLRELKNIKIEKKNFG